MQHRGNRGGDGEKSFTYFPLNGSERLAGGAMHAWRGVAWRRPLDSFACEISERRGAIRSTIDPRTVCSPAHTMQFTQQQRPRRAEGGVEPGLT